MLLYDPLLSLSKFHPDSTPLNEHIYFFKEYCLLSPYPHDTHSTYTHTHTHTHITYSSLSIVPPKIHTILGSEKTQNNNNNKMTADISPKHFGFIIVIFLGETHLDSFIINE